MPLAPCHTCDTRRRLGYVSPPCLTSQVRVPAKGSEKVCKHFQKSKNEPNRSENTPQTSIQPKHISQKSRIPVPKFPKFPLGSDMPNIPENTRGWSIKTKCPRKTPDPVTRARFPSIQRTCQTFPKIPLNCQPDRSSHFQKPRILVPKFPKLPVRSLASRRSDGAPELAGQPRLC